MTLHVVKVPYKCMCLSTCVLYLEEVRLRNYGFLSQIWMFQAVFLILKYGSCFGSTGEASNVDEYLWLMGRACYKPIIEYCGGTEIGGGFITGSFLQAQSLAAFSTPAMGCSLFILGSDGYPIVRTK